MASTKPSINQRRWRIIADKIHDEWCIQNGYPIKLRSKPQAASRKQASLKLKFQAASSKLQAPSSELQAASREHRAPRHLFLHKVSSL
jgi:hypothetical protein